MSRQRVVKFGTATPLSGVLTEPVTSTLRQPLAVIILNSGILHHVGANRLHVQIARRLSELGFASLRFDFSGVGDSESRRDHLSFEQSAPAETIEAIDYLVKSHGAKNVVLIGLCSGADVAHLTALVDDRVAGLGLLDPWAYQTRGYYLHYYGSRLVSPAVYANWIRVRLGRLRDRFRKATFEARDAEMYEMPQYIREFPPRERVMVELQAFMKRRLKLLVLFSGGLEEYNHRGQYRASFPEVEFGDHLREIHVPNSTHVFSALPHQAVVVRELAEWVQTGFGDRARTRDARPDAADGMMGARVSF